MNKILLFSLMTIFLINTNLSFSKELKKEDKTEILKLIFGNNFKIKDNVITHPVHKKILNSFNIETFEDSFYTEIIYTKEIKSNNKSSYIVVTETKSDTWQCHACAPIVGVLSVIEENNIFSIETPFNYIEQIGTWGKTPIPDLIKIGKDNNALLFSSPYTGMGMTVESKTIIAKVNNEFKNVLDIPETYEDNFGTCGKGMPYKCYQFSSKLSFPEINKKSFSSIIITKEGTAPDKNYKIKPFKKIKKYVFNVDKYK